MSNKKTVKRRKTPALVGNALLPAVPSYTISRKKKLELFGQVHEDIMQARTTILTLLREKLTKDDWNKIDNAFFRLHMDCPKKAVDVFTRHGR